MAKLLSANTLEPAFIKSIQVIKGLSGLKTSQEARQQMNAVMTRRPNPAEVSLDFSSYGIVVKGIKADESVESHLVISFVAKEGIHTIFSDKSGCVLEDCVFNGPELLANDPSEPRLDLRDQSKTGLLRLLSRRGVAVEGKRAALVTINEWFGLATFMPLLATRVKKYPHLHESSKEEGDWVESTARLSRDLHVN